MRTRFSFLPPCSLAVALLCAQALTAQSVSASHNSEPAYRNPFGYGLSYTTFKYSNLRVGPKQIQPGGNADGSVDVTNASDRIGDEVPQMYVHEEVASVTRPVMQLRGFERIALPPITAPEPPRRMP